MRYFGSHPPPTFLSSLFPHMHTRAISFTLFLTTLSLFHSLTLMHTTHCLSSYDTLSHLKLTLSHSLSLSRSHSPCSTWRRPLAVPADIAYTTALLSILLLSGLFTSMDICLQPMVSSLRPLIDYFLKWKEAFSTMVREHAPACCVFSIVEHVVRDPPCFFVLCDVQCPGDKELEDPVSQPDGLGVDPYCYLMPTVTVEVVDAAGTPCLPTRCSKSAEDDEPCHFTKRGTAMSTKKCGWTPNGPVVVAHQKYWCTTHKANFAARSSHRHRLIVSQRFEPIFVHLGKVSNSTRLEHSTCYCNCTGL